MASQLEARVARFPPPMHPSPEIWPEGFAQHRLHRLLELRAAIDSIRCEQKAQDPLLAWITAQEQT